jgi:hypothetical protein
MTPGIRNKLRTAARVAESGKTPAAIALYRELIADDQNLPEAWIGLGDLLKDPYKRAEAYQKALVIDPKNSEAINRLAILEGKIPPEITILKEKEKSEPEQNSDAHASSAKAGPNIGGVFSHPVDISAFVKADGSMVDYKTGAPTNLRGNRCGRPITLKSSQSTSVGYRCKICIRELEDGYYEATTADLIIGGLVTLTLSTIIGFLVPLVSGFGGFFIFFIAFAVGGAIGAFIARMAQQSIGRRRGRHLPNTFAMLMAMGIFLPGLIFGSFLISAIVAFAATSAARVQLR